MADLEPIETSTRPTAGTIGAVIAALALWIIPATAPAADCFCLLDAERTPVVLGDVADSGGAATTEDQQDLEVSYAERTVRLKKSAVVAITPRPASRRAAAGAVVRQPDGWQWTAVSHALTVPVHGALVFGAPRLPLRRCRRRTGLPAEA